MPAVAFLFSGNKECLVYILQGIRAFGEITVKNDFTFTSGVVGSLSGFASQSRQMSPFLFDRKVLVTSEVLLVTPIWHTCGPGFR